MTKLFILILTFMSSITFAQSDVELQLSSPLILEDGISFDITSSPIKMDEPCNYMMHNPIACEYDSNSKIMTVKYELEITPQIPSGKKGVLNVDISNSPTEGFNLVRLLNAGVPVVSNLEFINNTVKTYEIEFKIKINGDNVVPQPQVSINFMLEQETI